MNILLWTVQGVLAAFCLAAAANHLLVPMARLRTSTPWTEDVGEPRTRVIGGFELLAAIGLLLPGLTHIATVLTPLAAAGMLPYPQARISCFRSARSAIGATRRRCR